VGQIWRPIKPFAALDFRRARGDFGADWRDVCLQECIVGTLDVRAARPSVPTLGGNENCRDDACQKSDAHHRHPSPTSFG
jgi:hypothetical protein